MMPVRASLFQFASPDESPGFLLWQVANLWQRRMNQALQELDLTHVQFVLLAGIYWLSQEQETITQVQLASHAKTDIMMTSKVLRTLEGKELVERRSHPTDTRAKALALTQTGVELLAQAIKVVDDTDNTFFGPVSRVGKLNQAFRMLVEENEF